MRLSIKGYKKKEIIFLGFQLPQKRRGCHDLSLRIPIYQPNLIQPSLQPIAATHRLQKGNMQE